MAWWWPFSKKKLREVPAQWLSHSELAAQFFWMHRYEQFGVLGHLSVPSGQQAAIHSAMDPFDDVTLLLETRMPPTIPMSSETFMDKLRVTQLVGRGATAVAVLQNIFNNTSTAKAYAQEVEKWPVALKK